MVLLATSECREHATLATGVNPTRNNPQKLRSHDIPVKNFKVAVSVPAVRVYEFCTKKEERLCQWAYYR